MEALNIGNTLFKPKEQTIATITGEARLSTQRTVLLYKLTQHAGQPVAHRRLLDLIWNGRPTGPAISIIRVQMCYIRNALKEIESNCEINRIWGYGYVLCFPELVQHVHIFNGRQEGLYKKLLTAAPGYMQEALREPWLPEPHQKPTVHK